LGMSKKSKLVEADPDDLAVKYAAARPMYEAFTNDIAQLLATLLSSKGIEYLAIETRTKSVDSFRTKVVRPVKEGKYDTIESVTDLAGVRIIAFYQKDVDAICKLIERNFSVDVNNSVDKNDALAPDRFGYLSVHYIVSHHKEREKLAEHTAFSGLKAELQIRTVLQHAWAVLDRKLRYNNEEDIPRQVRRKLFRISALLEIADENFSEIDKIVSDLREQYASDIKGGNLEQEINLDSLEVFMREAASVKALEREAKKHYEISLVNEQSYSDPGVLKSVSNLVMSAHLAGIKTIKHLNDVVVEFNKIAKETFLHLVDLTTNDTFTTAGLIPNLSNCDSLTIPKSVLL
jgi:putative GTP pyrophosphokinase